MRSLTSLLHPYPLEDFLQNHWTQRSIMIPGHGEKTFQHLFSWEKLSDLLNFHDLKYPDLRLALDEKVLEERDNKKLIQHCQQGATLIIDHIHRLIPEAASFASELRYELGCSTQINTYCSYPGKQGFSCHYDTHEVFILQVDGKKQWSVFTDTLKYPLPDQKSSALTPPDEEPYISCVLTPGDVLYIPRGHWHYAIATDEPSLHLTLGVHCKTGIDVLEWLVNELRQQEEWRKSLPLRSETAVPEELRFAQLDATKTQSARHQISSLIEGLTKQLFQESELSIADHYLSSLEGLAKPIAPYSLPYQAGFNIFPQGTQTQYKRDPFQRAYITELTDQSGYSIRVAGKEISLKGVPKNFVDNLFQRTVFTAQDAIDWLPDFDWEIEIAPLLSRLVMEGIIFVDRKAE